MTVNTRRGIAPIAIVILVLLGIVGTATILKKKTPAATTPSAEIPSEEQTTTPSPTPTSKPASAAVGSITIKLSEENGSRQSGEAVLSDVNGKTKVVISLSGTPTNTPMPAHIYVGSCSKRSDVKYALAHIEKGASQTILDVPLRDVIAGAPFSVNIHKSASELLTYVACGSYVPAPAPQPTPTPQATAPNSVTTVRYTSTGFVPNTITVTRGQGVKFINDTGLAFWVVSNDHPGHSIYPGFDQGRSLGKGGVYTFTFNDPGTWKYHNENNLNHGGTVIVK